MGLLSRLVVKCVRSTTSLAVTLGQVILLLVVSSLVGANSETFRVSSSGDAARIQGSKMGDYLPTSYSAIQGHPVYQKTNGHKNFLYVSPNGFWTVGSVRGSTVSGIYNSQLPPCHQPAGGVTWTGRNGKRILPSRLKKNQPHQQVTLQRTVSVQWTVFSDNVFLNFSNFSQNQQSLHKLQPHEPHQQQPQQPRVRSKFKLG